jgi:hypothetical protein
MYITRIYLDCNESVACSAACFISHGMYRFHKFPDLKLLTMLRRILTRPCATAKSNDVQDQGNMQLRSDQSFNALHRTNQATFEIYITHFVVTCSPVQDVVTKRSHV